MRCRTLILLAGIFTGCRDAVEPKQTGLAPAVLTIPASPYELVELGTLGGAVVRAIAMNDQTQIVGSSETADGATHAFLWSDGVLRDLGTLGGAYSAAEAINSTGTIAGVSSDTTGAMRVVIWGDGGASPTDVGPALGPASLIQLSDGGHVTWAAPTPTGTHAMLWDGSQAIDLGTLGGQTSTPVAVNAQGQVAGNSTTASGTLHAFLWAGGVMRDLGTLGGQSGGAEDMNERGAVIGWSHDVSGKSHAVLWDGQPTDLGVLPRDSFSIASAINERDQIVGTSYPDVGAVFRHAFIWELAAMRPLNPAYATPGNNERVAALNDNGLAVGITVELRTGFTRPWVWEAGVLWDLPTRGPFSFPSVINNAGNIVGSSGTGVGPSAVLWRRVTPLP